MVVNAADHIRALEAELARVSAERDALAAELELARHFRKAVEEAPYAISRVDTVKGRYVFANHAFAEFAGQPHEGLLARDPYQVWVDSVHPEDFSTERNAVGEIATGEKDRLHFESRLIPSGGKRRWVRKHIVGSSNTEGRLAYLTIYQNDIDQERLASQARDDFEAQLQRAQKLEVVGRLVGGIAHDFNNRLVIIMGYCELLKSGLGPDNPLSAHAETVLTSAKGAAALTRQLLAYSRRQILNPQPFDLNEMVDRMHRLLKSVAGDRIELAVTLDARCNVLADSGQIEQVILNLAINARDAMEGSEGGRLTLETRDFVLGEGEGPGVAAGDYVALVVSDTGTGIPDDVLPRIFEPFFTTKEPGRGTGLGLAMVEGIVRQSGGWTGVESRPDVGSRFTVYLPQAKGPASPVAQIAEDSLPSKRGFETVLVCDDDDGVRTMLASVLNLRGYRILTARNGRHALEVAEAYGGKIHLLLTDLAMPGMGGLEVATVLRERDPELRVLYISGYTEDAELVSMSLGPRTYFVAKPFVPGDLTRAVSSILETRPT